MSNAMTNIVHATRTSALVFNVTSCYGAADYRFENGILRAKGQRDIKHPAVLDAIRKLRIGAACVVSHTDHSI